jgi:two-component system chemotaxis sensor kinase CheA
MPLTFDATPEELQLFLDEAEEHLQALADGFLRLERGGGDPELLQTIFRSAHTLKGAASAIGHQRMAQVTHALETVLDQMRQGKLEPDSAIIDVLLLALDGLLVLNQEVVSGEAAGLDVAEVVAALERIGKTPPVAPAAAPPRRSAAQLDAAELSQAEEAVSGGRLVLRLRVRIAPSTEWAQVRGFQVLQELAALGQVIRSVPTPDGVEALQPGDEVDAVFATELDPGEVQGRLAAIAEVEVVELRQYTLAERGGPQASPGAAGPLPAGGDPGGSRTGSAKTVRVDVERLDRLMNLVGELVVDRTRLAQIGARLEERYGGDPAVADLAETAQHIGRITDELQEEVMRSRMLPIENVFGRLPRLVRDLAQKMGKRVNLVIEGQETELDRSVIEELSDPLIHLLRNAVDHGIERPEERRAAGKPAEGTIRLTARHEEGYIVVGVEDDGRGIDPAKLRRKAVERGLLTREAADRLSDEEAQQLVFAPGLSTAEQVSDISGRGVGMDIVRSNVERVNGSVTLQSQPGAGTLFTIKLPLTLAIVRALLVVVGDTTYAVPLVSVTEALRVAADELHVVNRREVVQVRGKVLPLVRLAQYFGAPDRPEGIGADGASARPYGGPPRAAAVAGQRHFVVSVRAGSLETGLLVDRLVGEQEVVIKSLDSALGRPRGISGAAILGDGSVALILDVPGLVNGVIGR